MRPVWFFMSRQILALRFQRGGQGLVCAEISLPVPDGISNIVFKVVEVESARYNESGGAFGIC